MTVISEEILNQFNEWFEEAIAHPHIKFAETMNLATCDAEGNLSSRMVLLKEVDANGFVFFTNYHSHKATDMAAHDKVALCFYWESIRKQIRIEGSIIKTDDAASNAYFESRPRESQIGAWASHQSDILESREQLMQRFKEFEKKFEGQPVPRPPHWGGYVVSPAKIEFWKEGDFRLHERLVYALKNDVWNKTLLNP